MPANTKNVAGGGVSSSRNRGSGGGGSARVSGGADGGYVRSFSKGCVYSVKNNPLAGISLSSWIRIIYRYWWAIDFGRYWVRLLFVTLMACVNSLFWVLDWLFWRHAIQRAKVNPGPVFILGHPRTGTTLLHNLMSKDEQQFIFCSTFQAGFPCGFGVLGRFQWLLSGVVDDQRPMDNMALSLDLPQEDELAIKNLANGSSQYMACHLIPQEKAHFRQLVNFEHATDKQQQEWHQAFTYFIKKLSAVNDGGTAKRRLLLKSPVHTGRVKLLLNMFPDAQFIYLHRNPYRVYLSMVNMLDKAYPYMYLNKPQDSQIQDFILSQFTQLHRLYVRDRGLIPEGNLLELPFDTLSKDPIQAVESIYDHFGWENFEHVRPRLERYQKQNRGYKKNSFAGLHPAERKIVADRWREAFEEFGYALDEISK